MILSLFLKYYPPQEKRQKSHNVRLLNLSLQLTVQRSDQMANQDQCSYPNILCSLSLSSFLSSSASCFLPFSSLLKVRLVICHSSRPQTDVSVVTRCMENDRAECREDGGGGEGLEVIRQLTICGLQWTEGRMEGRGCEGELCRRLPEHCSSPNDGRISNFVALRHVVCSHLFFRTLVDAWGGVGGVGRGKGGTGWERLTTFVSPLSNSRPINRITLVSNDRSRC